MRIHDDHLRFRCHSQNVGSNCQAVRKEKSKIDLQDGRQFGFQIGSTIIYVLVNLILRTKLHQNSLNTFQRSCLKP